MRFKLLSIFAALLIAAPAWGVIVLRQQNNDWGSDSSETQCNISVTTISQFDVVYLAVMLDHGETISGTPSYDSAGDNHSMSLVTDTANLASNGTDQVIFLYEYIEEDMNVAGTETVTADFSSDNHYGCHIIVADGTHTTTPTHEFDTVDSASNCTTADTSVTIDDSSQAIATWTVWNGGDICTTSTCTYTGITELWEQRSGTSGTADDSFHVGWDIGPATGAKTPSSNSSVGDDECASVSIIIDDAATVGRTRRFLQNTPLDRIKNWFAHKYNPIYRAEALIKGF